MKFVVLVLLLIAQTVFARHDDQTFLIPRDCVSGGFVGVGLGYAAGPMKMTQPTANAAGPAPLSAYKPFPDQMITRPALSGFVGNLNMGYDFGLGDSCWSIGFIGGGSFTVIKGRLPFVAANMDNIDFAQATSVSGELTPTKLTDQGNFDAGLRAGYLFNNRVFCFTHVGWSIHRIVFETPESIKRWPKWYNCLLVGVGIDIRVTPHTVIGIALDTHIGARSQTVFYQNGTGARVSFFMRPLLAQGMTVFKYRIPVAPSAYDDARR